MKIHYFKDVNLFKIPNLIERSQFNKQRRKLFDLTELIRQKLAVPFLEFQDYYIANSMLLEIFKFTGHLGIKICKKDFETVHLKGYCPSQHNWFYGYKLHGVCSIDGIFYSIEITKAECMILIF